MISCYLTLNPQLRQIVAWNEETINRISNSNYYAKKYLLNCQACSSSLFRMYNTRNLYGWSESRSTSAVMEKTTGRRANVISRWAGLGVGARRCWKKWAGLWGLGRAYEIYLLDRPSLHPVATPVIGWETTVRRGMIWGRVSQRPWYVLGLIDIRNLYPSRTMSDHF